MCMYLPTSRFDTTLDDDGVETALGSWLALLRNGRRASWTADAHLSGLGRVLMVFGGGGVPPGRSCQRSGCCEGCGGGCDGGKLHRG